jgi:hypothetical protein
LDILSNPNIVSLKNFGLTLIVSLFIISPTALHAQRTPAKGPIGISLLTATGTITVPAGDLAERFGPHAGISLNFARKTVAHWHFSFAAEYQFGQDVREPGLFAGITQGTGNVISEAGIYADVISRMRSIQIWGSVGKLIPMWGNNKNSGLLLQLGAGIWQHKIYLQNQGFFAPQISGDYLKGYDRLSGGPFLRQSIGYLNLSNKKLINYYIGLDFTQGFTQGQRGLNYDTGLPDNEGRLDLGVGVRVGWILPFYRREDRDFIRF